MTKQQLRFGFIPSLAVIVALALGLSACGGGSPSGPSGPTRQVVGTRSWQLAATGFQFFDVTLDSATGTLDATAQWTSSGNDVDLYVTNSLCSLSAFSNGVCPILAKADSVSNKPERITLIATNTAYRFVVFNLGPGSESGTLEVGVTR